MNERRKGTSGPPAFARGFFARLVAEHSPLDGEAVLLRWPVQPDDGRVPKRRWDDARQLHP